MLLGTLLRDLADETSAEVALEALGDVGLFARVKAMGTQFEETPGLYAAGAARRFACSASNEDWLGLMNALERGNKDPASTALGYMVGWSLRVDEATLQTADSAIAGAHAGCGCGGGGTCHGH
ncbi:MAG TPA: hypothetical protein PKD49_03305 [Hyphomicrobium sp.]|nr:hypothetical protein [Hyphomicrobium sp.]